MGKKRHPAGVILLSIVTLGIYFFVWFYKNNEELNEVSGKDFASLLWTLLFLLPLVGLVGLYFFSDHISAALAKKNIQGRSTLVRWLLMAIPLVNIVGLPLAQSEINKVWA